MLFTEGIAVYSENHTKHTNTVRGQNSEILNFEAGITQLPLRLKDCGRRSHLKRIRFFLPVRCQNVFSSASELYCMDITCLNKR